MLDIYTQIGWQPIIEKNNYYTDYDYGGLETLCFDIPITSHIAQYLKNEALVRNDENLYSIKQVNRMKTKISVTCKLDLDDWKQGKPYITTKEDVHFQSKTLHEILTYCKPKDWQILNADISSTRETIELDDASSYDILMQCLEVFQMAFLFRVRTKEIYILDPEADYDTGLYITPQLNLKTIEWKGNSETFCTRLYCYGKKVNGISIDFADINDGKEYIEDYRYIDKCISMVWRSEDYDTPETLLEAGKQKLKEVSVPDMSYSVTIHDLASIYPEYDFLQFGLYKQVHTIIDKDVSIIQRIVKIRKFHNDSKNNVITLSSVASKITTKIDKITSSLKKDNKKLEGSILQEAKSQATAIINDFAKSGHKYETENETYFLDTLPKEKAKYVMRQNLGGIAFSQTGIEGPYITAWTIDGKFNADFITTGTLQAIKIVGSEMIGGQIQIGDHFHVNANGDALLSSAKVKGEIEALSGIVANWNISQNSLSSTVTKNYSFNQNDLHKIRDYIMGEISLTKQEIDRYDINGDGKVSALDYAMILNLIKETDLYSKASISLNANDLRNMISIEITEGYRKGVKTSLGAYAISTNQVITNDIDFPYGRIGSGSIEDKNTLSIVGDNALYLHGDDVQISTKNLMSSVPLTVSSDQRKKKNMKDIDISWLDEIHIIAFDYTDGPNHQIGIVANEYEDKEYAKYFLTKDEDGYYAVTYSNMTNALIKYCQLLKQRIDKLEEEMEEIKNESSVCNR